MSESESRVDMAAREIVTTRLIDAPRALVFAAWTEVKHLEHWFGPDGFTTTTTEMNFKPGGKWLFTMHGPDGRDYPYRVIYHDIVPNERIDIAHDGGEDSDIQFRQTVTFEEEAGKTRITMHAVFPTTELLEFVIKEHKAVEGGQQTIARLDAYVTGLKN